MEAGGGVRANSSTLGILDAIIIISVITLLGGTLTRLVVLKIPRLAAHAEEQMRVAKSQMNLNLIGPQQAVAGAPPVTLEEVLPPFPIDFDRFVAPPMMLSSFAPGDRASVATTPRAKKERRLRRSAQRYSARQSSTRSPTQK